MLQAQLCYINYLKTLNIVALQNSTVHGLLTYLLTRVMLSVLRTWCLCSASTPWWWPGGSLYSTGTADYSITRTRN